MSSIQQPAARQALMRAISPDRLTTYQHAANQARQDVLDLYLWDRDTAAAALADIAILEVAMRNAMHTTLANMAGRPDWYRLDIGLDDRSLKAITAAWNRLPDVQRTPGRVVAQLMFGFWRDLLERGGSRGAGPLRTQANYDDIWRQGLYRAFPGGRLEARAAGEQWTRTSAACSPACAWPAFSTVTSRPGSPPTASSTRSCGTSRPPAPRLPPELRDINRDANSRNFCRFRYSRSAG